MTLLGESFSNETIFDKIFLIVLILSYLKIKTIIFGDLQFS